MSVLSPTICLYVKKSFTFGQKFHPHPFAWNEKLGRPELNHSKSKSKHKTSQSKSGSIWFFNFGFVLFHWGFLVSQTVRLNSVGVLTQEMTIYLLLLLVILTVLPIFQLNYWRMRDLFPHFVIQLLDLTEKFNDDFQNYDSTETEETAGNNRGSARVAQDTKKIQEQRKRRTKSTAWIFRASESFFAAVYSATHTVVVLPFLLNILLPKSPELISSVILPLLPAPTPGLEIPHGILKWTVILMSASCHSYNWFILAALVHLIVSPAFSFILAGIITLQKIKSWLKTHATRKEPFHPEGIGNILKIYKQLEILRKSFHLIYCTMIFPVLKAACVLAVVFSIYGAIRMEGFIKIFLALLALSAGVIIIVLVSSFARFHTLSTEIQFLMKSPEFQKNLNECQKKVVGSLGLIQVKMGSSYVVDKKCVRTLYQILLENTINFLLTYR